MEKQKNIFCAWVNGDLEDLDRATVKEQFSKFGNVSKIFIDTAKSYAKVYLDSLESLQLACDQLSGFKSWEVKVYRDTYIKHDFDNGAAQNSFTSKSHTPSFASNSNGNFQDDMEEDCTFAGDYVDVHGKPVEVLQAENGQLYVNLDDVRVAGFNIYKKESFQNAIISQDVELRHFENFLLNQGRKYILDMKKTFDENQMLGVFERVRAKMQNKSVGEFGQGRIINSAPNSKNFTITKSVMPTPVSPAGGRIPTELANNFQPSFSHMKQWTKKDSDFDDRMGGRQSGPASGVGGPRRSHNSYDNRRDRNDDRRKSHEPNHGFAEVNHQPPHKSIQNEEIAKNVKSKAVANANAKEDPEDSLEGDVTPPPKSKPQNDNVSVASERKLLNVDRQLLTLNDVYKVKVSYIKPDKKSLFYGQWVEDVNQLQEILLHVNMIDNLLPEIAAPARDMLCVAQFEDCWYRAIVLHASVGTSFVELIDYGNKEHVVTPLREMSEDMKKIPGLAIRFAVHQNIGCETDDLILNTDQELEVFVKKHISDEYDDLTHLVEIRRILDGPKLDEEPPSPPSELSSDQESQQKPTAKPADSVAEDCFTQIPPSTAKLTNGESVMIVGYTENKFILRNKETAKNCKDVYGHLLEMEKKPIANPKVGQLVLCSRDGMEGLHRAIIKQISNEVAELEYLDYYGGETLTLKSLRNVDKLLATYPSAKIESPNIEWLNKVTEKSDSLLANLIVNKTKLKVILDGVKFDLLLVVGDKTVPLSQKVDQLENPHKEEPKKPIEQPPPKEVEPVVQPSPKKEQPVLQPPPKTPETKSKKIMYDDMPYSKPEKGLGSYFFYNCKGDSVTLLSAADAEKYLGSICIENEAVDNVPYEPENYEMCLAKFEDVWYRSLATEEGDGTFDVVFVDFGNAETVPKRDIRRFPAELAEIPLLGIGAYFMGIPDNPKVHAKLIELIPDETFLEADVKTDINEGLKYGIEIPEIYSALKNEQLI